MRVLATICARGGSKGIPGKNIKILNGRPLILYTISAAKRFQVKFPYVDIVLSTDSEEVACIAEQGNLTVDYQRPQELGEDWVGKIEVIKDALVWKERVNNCKYDYVLDLDVTSPLRTLDDLVAAFKMIQTDKDALTLFSVSPANRNPYFNMVEKNKDGYYELVKTPDVTVLTRQTTPNVYDMNASFYFYQRDFFERNYKGPITQKSLVYVVPHICFDLDHPLDFEILDFLIQSGKLDFEI